MSCKKTGFKVTVTSNQPSLKLKSTVFNLNTRYPGAETASNAFSFVNLPSGAKGEISMNGVTYSRIGNTAANFEDFAGLAFADGKASVSLKKNIGKGTYSYYVEGLKVRCGSTESTVPRFRIDLKLKDTNPSIKVTAKNVLNPVDPSSKVVYTAKLNNISGAVTGVKLWETNNNGVYYHNGSNIPANRFAKHFTVSQDSAKPDVVYLSAVADESDPIQNNKNYKLTLVYSVQGVSESETWQQVNVNVKPKQVFPAIKTDKTKGTIFAGQRDPSIKVKITPKTSTGAVMTTPELASNTSKSLKKAFTVSDFDPVTGEMTLKLKNPSAIKMNSKYSLNIVTKYRGQMDKTTANTFKLEVTVRK